MDDVPLGLVVLKGLRIQGFLTHQASCTAAGERRGADRLLLLFPNGKRKTRGIIKRSAVL